MTEYSSPVTSDQLTRLARLYFDHVGATVVENGGWWRVKFLEETPDALEASVDEGTLAVAVEADSTADEAVAALEPGSDFARQLTEAAGTVTPVARASLTWDTVDLRAALPSWLRESPVEVDDVRLQPYYDRTLLAVWIRVEIETPSQYQREQLHLVTVDPADGERVDSSGHTIAESLTDGTGPKSGTSQNDDFSSVGAVDSEVVSDGLEIAREAVTDDVRSTVTDVQAKASAAARESFQNYHQLQRERTEALDAEIDSISEELSEIGEKLESSASGSGRVELLERREELRSRRSDYADERSTLETAAERGYPERRQELRRRHEVSVETRPVAVTILSVERGDLEVTVATDRDSTTLELAFGTGRGVVESVDCPRCGTGFSDVNCLQIESGRHVCDDCL